MILFGGFGLTGEIKKLGAVKANSLGALRQGVVYIFGKFDVRLKGNDMTIDCLGG